MFKDTLGPEQLALENALGEVRLAARRLPAENTPETRDKMQAAVRRAAALLHERCGAELDGRAQAVVSTAAE